ncbi:MAG: Lrp/AsnC family transcriptional regulator [Promethearchaeota archaeon]
MVRFSDFDLISILRNNARTPYVKIAETLGVTEAAIRKRIRKLESQGVIIKYTIKTNLRKIGFEVHALIGMDTEPDQYLATLDKLKDMPEVVGLQSCGGDHMIMIECWFKTSQELAKFTRQLESMKSVTKVCPAIILEKIK